ncbi:hypothetical protein EXS71_03070 [Candidatus Uhrbacteria bacterium]|nr:hypothetical protein [Candidatus Uhrbacteria bacterium]
MELPVKTQMPILQGLYEHLPPVDVRNQVDHLFHPIGLIVWRSIGTLEEDELRLASIGSETLE